MTAVSSGMLRDYSCLNPLNLYVAPTLAGLATQASAHRQLQILTRHPTLPALEVRLCEDGYRGWICAEQLSDLQVVTVPYQAIAFDRSQIEAAIPAVIAFVEAASRVPNEYLWGGTLGPNYDCSGLIQTAFAASGIWLPRNSYQQEAFTKRIKIDELLSGDLIFFGEKRVDHVAIYLGEGLYLHSSGQATGRNGIAIDPLVADHDEISHHYFQKFWSCGRVMGSYCPPLFSEDLELLQ
jgi:cell wall-associated NlpC family hydrolase